MNTKSYYPIFLGIKSIFSKHCEKMDQFLPKSPISHIEHPKTFPMNRLKTATLLGLLAATGVFYQNFSQPEEVTATPCLDLPTEVYESIKRNGKMSDAERLSAVYTTTGWESLGFPVIDEKTVIALQHQLHVLEEGHVKVAQKMGNLKVNYDDLKEVIDILLQRANTQPNDLHNYLDAWQTWGSDRRGNVHFTGYFTPVVKVKKHKDKTYKFPLYTFPEGWEGPLPTRAEIDGKGALEKHGLALAYAANPFDVYVMQLQGSGTVEFVDTKDRQVFQYAGENGHPYRNIEHFFKNRKDLEVGSTTLDGIGRFLSKHPDKVDSVLFYNPSYTFFTAKKGLAKGAGEVPLMADISIAADPRYFPMGSVVLAAVPVYQNGKITHHQYRLLLPQDVGGSIKGAGHVDLYCGNGEIGRKKASAMHHYGRMWVLLPKKNEQMALKDEL